MRSTPGPATVGNITAYSGKQGQAQSRTRHLNRPCKSRGEVVNMLTGWSAREDISHRSNRRRHGDPGRRYDEPERIGGSGFPAVIVVDYGRRAWRRGFQWVS